jgi:predicted 3-demethylubiquinone-9 3-methyltransferase (glyoxalase superfamily)
MAMNPTKAGAAAPSRDERAQPTTQKITTFLWFDDNAEEAVKFYTSVFKNSRIIDTTRYGTAGPGPEGTVMTIEFELDGQRFTALNGGPQFKFTEAISLVVHCETQEEVDHYWEKLSEDGQKVDCGWVKDKFGLSWQVTPEILLDLLRVSDKEKSERVMKAMMTMKKLDIDELQKAAAGGS